MTASYWSDKRILITGVCGTVGQELLRQLVPHAPLEILGIDNNESALFFLAEEYRRQDNVRVFLGDLRDRDELFRKFDGIDVVLHTAALKHVILCERSPGNAVHTNIVGTQNVIDASIAGGVSRMLFTSSDKAVNPTNVMGTSKLMCERLVTAANAVSRDNRTILASTRFGNVLGSRGSVIPLFRKQILAGGPVTLTDDRMTRFIMSLSAAVSLVLESVTLARGGEIFVTKMPVIRIRDLAEVMIEHLAPRCGRKPTDIKLEVIGQKAGEKLYEELLNDEETRRTIELPDYFVLKPAFSSIYSAISYEYPGGKPAGDAQPYNSNLVAPMSKADLAHYLATNSLLDEDE